MSVKFVRPDFSDYVVHFTKDEIPITHTDETIPREKRGRESVCYERAIKFQMVAMLH